MWNLFENDEMRLQKWHHDIDKLYFWKLVFHQYTQLLIFWLMPEPVDSHHAAKINSGLREGS